MGSECRECREDVAHCHGALIHHVTLRAECTEEGCTSPESVPHVFVVDCVTIGCVCAQPIGSADSNASWMGSTAVSG